MNTLPSPGVPMPTAELVRELRNIKYMLNCYGWVRGTMGSERMGFCLLGAIYNIDYSQSLRDKLIEEISQGLRDRYAIDTQDPKEEFSSSEQNCLTLVAFNDNYARNRAEVVKFLDELIAEVAEGLPTAAPDASEGTAP